MNRRPGIGETNAVGLSAAADSVMVSIGTLARATDIPAATLRTWERRYGYPVPQRKPSGHRLYSTASISRLRQIASALDRGYRAGEVVPVSEDALSRLLASAPTDTESAHRDSADPADLMKAVESFDSEALARLLTDDWARLGPIDFLTLRIVPLVEEIGLCWRDGRLDIAHEHFVSERLSDLLRSFRIPIETRAGGPLVVLAAPAGEMHGLGLQMAALTLAVAGWRTCNLGPNTPVDELIKQAKRLRPLAVGISISSANGGRKNNAGLQRLRAGLTRRTHLLVGGAGAPADGPGLTLMGDLGSLCEWGRRLAKTAA